jgi:hypothetical protein
LANAPILSKYETGSFPPEHFIRCHTLDPEPNTGIGDLYLPYTIAGDLVSNNDVGMPKGVGYQVIIGNKVFSFFIPSN